VVVAAYVVTSTPTPTPGYIVYGSLANVGAVIVAACVVTPASAPGDDLISARIGRR
jgi:hypothetical protein